MADAQAYRVAFYRFGPTFRRRRSGYLAIVLFGGLAGGLSMASVAAARTTQTSYAVYLASTNPSQLSGVTGILNPRTGTGTYDSGLVQRIARLPHVRSVVALAGIDIVPLTSNGSPIGSPAFYPPAAGNGYGSLIGLGFTQDRATALSGTLPNPDRADEFMLDTQTAAALHVHVGQTVPIGIYTNRQTTEAGFGTIRVKPFRVIEAKLTGVGVLSTSSVIADQTDQGGNGGNLFTPALTRQLLSCCSNYSGAGVKVDNPRNVVLVSQEIQRVLPPGFPPFSATNSSEGKASRALRPVSIALAAFGGIAGLAAILIAAQLISRRLRRDAEERAVLRALGASPVTVAVDELVGIIAAVIAAALLAVVVAIALSPLAPLGPVRPVYPDLGVSFDSTVLAIGTAILVVALGAFSIGLAYREAPHRLRARQVADQGARSQAAGMVASIGLPPTAVAGMRFALEPGSGRTDVPARSAIVGAAMAVLVLTATVTFGASLNALVSQPRLYGWNWDAALVTGGDIPQAQVTTLLRHDRYVSAFSGVYTPDEQIDGQEVAVMGIQVGSPVEPVTLSGHGLEALDEVLLGPDTLAQLHKRVGDRVTVSSGVTPAVELRVVGTVAMPAIGSTSGGAHLEMGSGALLSSTLVPPSLRNPFSDPIPGPNVIPVRFVPGANAADAMTSLDQIASATSNTANFGVLAVRVLKPAEILSYGSLGSIPLYLGACLAAGAMGALGLTLVSSVRRRRRDLAVLKTLGFTGRQLAATVMWQSSTAVILGSIVGVPLGVVVGRWLWDLFARDIRAVPYPSVPVVSVVLIFVGALVLSNVVAAFPGRLAARTPTGLLLRAD